MFKNIKISGNREDVQIQNEKRDLEVTKAQFNEQLCSKRVEKDVIKKSRTTDRQKEVTTDTKHGKLAD